MDYLNQFFEWEANYDGMWMIEFTRQHNDIPIFAVTLYLVTIFYLPQYLTKPIKMRKMFATWNLILSVFSFCGVYRIVPLLINAVRTKGFVWSVCTDPSEWYLKGAPGLWTTLFIYSKLPELCDTMFLVLQKKKVIFLHWFHHLTVLLYCWHAFHHNSAPGIWFTGMNYSVHSVMYLYYFLSIIGARKFAKPFAPLITAVQVLQMVGGVAVTIVSAYQHMKYGREGCAVVGSNYRMGLLMYSCYLVLFVILFKDLYCSDKKKKKTKKAPGICRLADDGEDASKGAGFFQRPDGAEGGVQGYSFPSDSKQGRKQKKQGKSKKHD